jgi:hypothetical protein
MKTQKISQKITQKLSQKLSPKRNHSSAQKPIKAKNTKELRAKTGAESMGRPISQAAKPLKAASKLSQLASFVGLGAKKAAKPAQGAKAQAHPKALAKTMATKNVAKTPAKAQAQVAAKSSKSKAPEKKAPAAAVQSAKKGAAAKPVVTSAKSAAPAAELKKEAKKETKPASPARGGKKKQVLSAPQLALQSATANIRASRGGGPRREESSEVCREVACEGLSTTAGYCRLHYIKNWKKIKRKEVILKEGKLNQYIEELVLKYPDKYIEAIRQDLASDKDFAKVIYDLDLDEGTDEFDPEGESMDAVIDTIKRDFDDEGDTGF